MFIDMELDSTVSLAGIWRYQAFTVMQTFISCSMVVNYFRRQALITKKVACFTHNYVNCMPRLTFACFLYMETAFRFRIYLKQVSHLMQFSWIEYWPADGQFVFVSPVSQHSSRFWTSDLKNATFKLPPVCNCHTENGESKLISVCRSINCRVAPEIFMAETETDSKPSGFRPRQHLEIHNLNKEKTWVPLRQDIIETSFPGFVQNVQFFSL